MIIVVVVSRFTCHVSKASLRRVLPLAAFKLAWGLQAMEGAMVGLQEAQVDSMRRLTAGLTDAIGEAQLTLQVRSGP